MKNLVISIMFCIMLNMREGWAVFGFARFLASVMIGLLLNVALYELDEIFKKYGKNTVKKY